MSGREPTSAAFEPERLAPRRRRVDPLVLGAAVVVLGIGAAIVKPWGSATGPSTAVVASPSASDVPASPSVGPAAGAAGTPPDVASGPAVGWPQVAAAIQPHAAWGVRALVQDMEPASAGEAPGLVERWLAVEPGTAAGSGSVALLATGDQPVLALGLSFPPGDLPLDVRVWQATEDRGWRWVDGPPLEPSAGLGAFVLGPPMVDHVQQATWPVGQYRIEVLTASGIREIAVALPGRWEQAPGRAPATPPDPSLDSPFAPSWAADGRPGIFVVEDGVARHVDAPAIAPGIAGDRLLLWQLGTAAVHAPRANGIGVMLPSRTRDLDATLVRLDADGAVDPGGRRVQATLVDDQGRWPYAVFRSPGGTAWPAGTYRLDTRWTAIDGSARSASYPLDIRPSELGASPALDALRALALARVGPRATLGYDADLAPTPTDVTCGDGGEAQVAPVPRYVGIGHDVRAAPATVTAELLLGGRTVEQRLLVAPGARPGLTIVAAADRDRFVPGVYRLTIGDGPDAERRTICVGVELVG